MNAYHPVQNPRVLLGAAVLLGIVLFVGCHEIPVEPDAGDQAVPEAVAASKKCDNPPCGGGGGDDGGGGGGGFTVAMTGGLEASAQVLDSFRDNNKSIRGGIESGNFNLALNLAATRADALALAPGCSFNCDDAAFANSPLSCTDVHGILADFLVNPAAVSWLSIMFDKDDVLAEEPASSCHFTSLLGGEVIIRNCMVTFEGDPDDIDNDAIPRTFLMHAHEANRVEAARRFDSNNDGTIGSQDFRATLFCPLKDPFDVTFAPEQP